MVFLQQWLHEVEWSWHAKKGRDKYSFSTAERNNLDLQKGMKIKIFGQGFCGGAFRNNNHVSTPTESPPSCLFLSN